MGELTAEIEVVRRVFDEDGQVFEIKPYPENGVYVHIVDKDQIEIFVASYAAAEKIGHCLITAANEIRQGLKRD